MKKILTICTVFVLLIAVSACNYLFPTMPPFRYIKLAVSMDSNGTDVYKYMGLRVTIQNTTGNTITGVKAEFDLYDKDGPFPKQGAEHVTASFSGITILENETKELIYSLDSLFYFDPSITKEYPYLAKNFRIVEVERIGLDKWYDYVAAYPFPGVGEFIDNNGTIVPPTSTPTNTFTPTNTPTVTPSATPSSTPGS